MNQGKIKGLVATPGRLWAILFEQAKSSFHGFPIWLSTDGGRELGRPIRQSSLTCKKTAGRQ